MTTPGAAKPTTRGYSRSRKQYLDHLKRIEGQVRGIARMVDEDVYCVDVLTQISAVIHSLESLSLGLVEDHLGHCVAHAVRDEPDHGQAKIREAVEAIARIVKS